MDYYCEVGDIFLKPLNKYKHFKSITHKELNKGIHIKLTIENRDKNDIDKPFNEYIIQHNKKHDY